MDATDVYFTEIGYFTGNMEYMPVPGLVGRLSRVDGSMVTLAGTEPGPSQIALNALGLPLDARRGPAQPSRPPLTRTGVSSA